MRSPLARLGAKHIDLTRLPLERCTPSTRQSISSLTEFRNAVRLGSRLQKSNLDQRQNIDSTLIVSDEALIAHLMMVAADTGIELLDDVDIVEVVDAHLSYFDAIGAVGPTAPPDDVI